MLDVFLDYLQRHDPAREIAPAAWLRFAVAALTHAYAVLRPRYINAISDRLLHDTKSVLDQFWIALESPNGASRWKSALSRIDALRADAAPNEGVRIGAGAPGWRLLLDGLAHAARAGRASDPTHEAISAAKSAELAVRCWAQETAAHAAWRAATPDTPWPTAAPEQAEAIAKLGAGRLGAYEPLVRAEERFHERSLDRVRSGDLISYAEATRLDPESRLAEESISTAEPARLSEPIAPRLAAQSKSPQNLPRRSRMVDVQLQHVPLADMRSVPRRWQLNFTTAAVTHAFTVLRPHLGDWLRGATLEGVLRIIDEHWHADEQDRSIESPDYVNHPQR
ncbi:MAG TPA: hypothetical protein VGE52_19175, partial [Pirellulales bacterium]